MTETICRWDRDEKNHVLPGRHDDCDDETCRGCQRCEEYHCLVCRKVHHDTVCPKCLGDTRDHLWVIHDMCHRLPLEVLNGKRWLDALMMLGGGSTDGKGRVWARERGGDVSHYADERRGDPVPPLVLLVSWEDAWRDFLDHPATNEATIDGAVSYLDQQMTYMAGRLEVPFSDFTQELRRLRRQLEGILHDERTLQTGTPCLRCSTPLERDEDASGVIDRWTCPKCHREYDEQAYRNALSAGYQAAQAEVIAGETWAVVDRAATEVRRSTKTIREWVRRGLVARACLIAGRRDVVSVDDARRENETRMRRNRGSAA